MRRLFRGPRSLIGLVYSTFGLILAGPFFRQGESRLENLWYIYMTPMFDEESSVVLFLVALTSLGIGAVYFLSYFFDSLAEYLSDQSIGRLTFGLSVALAIVAMTHFSRPIASAFFFLGTPLCAWAWFRADPDDNW